MNEQYHVFIVAYDPTPLLISSNKNHAVRFLQQYVEKYPCSRVQMFSSIKEFGHFCYNKAIQDELES